MKKYNLLGFLALFFVCANFAFAQIVPRTNTRSVLEPDSVVMSGAGQSSDAFENYWNVMKPGNKPLIYMTYVGLKNCSPTWSEGLKQELHQYPLFVMPQIGLSMTSDGNPSAHYEDDVADGLYDEQIENFIQGLKHLARPVYIRIGYEFNGSTWNGYQAETYKQAFVRITQKIREANVEAATVWCFAVDGDVYFPPFYPGDEYVDWWGIDLFSADHLIAPITRRFLDSAAVHQKPVMIGESTPRYVGTTDGQTSWEDWFEDYFNLIYTRPEIKMFNYINWDWSQYPQWANWGDCRLEANEYVKNRFANEMDSAVYLHAQSETQFRKRLGYNDDQPPPTPQNFALADTVPITLRWNSISDQESGLAHYTLWRNDSIFSYTLDTVAIISNLTPGDIYKYELSAMDRAGNHSAKSLLWVSAPNPIDIALNSCFENANFWVTQQHQGAEFSFSIDTLNAISEPSSGSVHVTTTGTAAWHLQLFQPLQVQPGMFYQVEFKAKADRETQATLMVQENHAPWEVFLNKKYNFSTQSATFKTDSIQFDTTDQIKFGFNLGDAQEGTKFWFDDFHVWLYNPTATVEKPNNTNKNVLELTVFPNPVKNNANIQFALQNATSLTFQITDMQGCVIQTFPSKNFLAGKQNFSFPTARLQAGNYILIAKSGKKMMGSIRFYKK